MPKSYFVIPSSLVMMLQVTFAQSDKSITIHQEIEFNASPQQLYEALLDSKQFTEISGRPAEIDREQAEPDRADEGRQHHDAARA